MATTAAEQVRTPVKERVIDHEDGDLLAWFRARQKVVTVAAGSILAIGLVTWYVIESGRRKQAQAVDALERARTAIETGNLPDASTQLQKISQTYSGTDAALEATLTLNQVRLMSGQAQLAVDELKKFIATNPPGAFGAAAHAHLAMALENTGKGADATAEYLKAAELAPEAYRKVDAMLAAARTYRAHGKDAEAIAVLGDIIKKFPKEAAGVAEAEVRLGELTKGR